MSIIFMNSQKRKQIIFQTSPEEKKIISDHAKKLSLPIASFCRTTILKKIREDTRKE
jgi:hypothetical protein